MTEMKPRRLYMWLLCVIFIMSVLFLFTYSSLESPKRMSGKKIVVPRNMDYLSGVSLDQNQDPLPLPYQAPQSNSSAEKTETWRMRLIKLRESCDILKQKNLIPDSVPSQRLDHIIVDDRYKVMYCYIPKVACTNMKRVFLLLTGKMNTTNPLDIKGNDVHFTHDKYLRYLDTYKYDEIHERINNYKKLIFVREPFERLLSAFRNKFLEKSDYFHKRFGRRIIRRFRKNGTPEAIQKGNDVKFEEFVKYLLDPVTKEQEGYNEHWAHYSTLCHPCQIQYDFIGKYETIDEDVDHVLSMLNIKSFIKFPARGATYKKKKTKDTMLDYFKTIEKDDLRNLWWTFVNDYKLFNYPYPEVLKEFLD